MTIRPRDTHWPVSHKKVKVRYNYGPNPLSSTAQCETSLPRTHYSDFRLGARTACDRQGYTTGWQKQDVRISYLRPRPLIRSCGSDILHPLSHRVHASLKARDSICSTGHVAPGCVYALRPIQDCPILCGIPRILENLPNIARSKCCYAGVLA